MRRTRVDPREALRAEKQARQSIAAPAEPTVGGETIEALCREYLLLKGPRWRPSMQRSITRIVNAEILPRWGKRPVTSLRRGEIVDARDAIAGRAPILANRWLWCVNNLLEFAVERERLDANAAAGIRRASKEKPRIRSLDDVALGRMLAWLPTSGLSDGVQELLRLVLLTGCRLGEACGPGPKSST